VRGGDVSNVRITAASDAGSSGRCISGWVSLMRQCGDDWELLNHVSTDAQAGHEKIQCGGD
jgi:hypothetical protein